MTTRWQWQQAHMVGAQRLSGHHGPTPTPIQVNSQIVNGWSRRCGKNGGKKCVAKFWRTNMAGKYFDDDNNIMNMTIDDGDGDGRYG